MNLCKKQIVILTGSNGYLGSALKTALNETGYIVYDPSGHDLSEGPSNWRFSTPISVEICKEAIALIHLAHIWERPDQNYEKTMELLTIFRNFSDGKFIFASSLSAQPCVRNAYGDVKRKIEGELNGSNEVSVRIGLVYGGVERGLWKTLCDLASTSRLIFVAHGHKLVHPISVDEVTANFLELVKARDHGDLVYFCSTKGYRFDQLIRLIRINKGLKHPFLFNLHSSIFDFLFRILRTIIPDKLRDRIEGLINLEQADFSNSMVFCDDRIEAVFASNKSIKKHLTAEAFYMLKYYIGHQPSHNAIKAYKLLVLKNCNGSPVFSNSISLKNNFLMAINEPRYHEKHVTNIINQRHSFARFVAATQPEHFLKTIKPIKQSQQLLLLASGLVTETIITVLRFIRSRAFE